VLVINYSYPLSFLDYNYSTDTADKNYYWEGDMTVALLFDTKYSQTYK
jgi:hypothetical protein